MSTSITVNRFSVHFVLGENNHAQACDYSPVNCTGVHGHDNLVFNRLTFFENLFFLYKKTVQYILTVKYQTVMKNSFKFLKFINFNSYLIIFNSSKN